VEYGRPARPNLARPSGSRPPARIQDRSRLVRSRRVESVSPVSPAPVFRQQTIAKPAHIQVQPQVQVVAPQPFARPALPKMQRSAVLNRQVAVQPQPKPMALPKPVKQRRSKLQMTLVGMAILVFGLGLLVNVQTLQTNHDAKAQVSALASKADNDDSGATPSETKPTGGRPYSVAPNLPKYLKINKLGVSSRVIALGVTTKNELKAPTNIYDTGWYNASANPGDTASMGAVLIDGHVHGPTLPGVFYNLKKLVAGDTIQIVRGDDQIFTYEVRKVQNYDADKLVMGMTLNSIEPGKAGLNLITCGGKFNKVTQQYEQRTVVFAVQI
jgi:sortase (surface protein transpeptidase)